MDAHTKRKSITLIGMPGAGKSRIGKMLAERLGYRFIDVDDEITELCRAERLQDVTDLLSRDEFLSIEGAVGILALLFAAHKTVFAPGGSMIYSPIAMERFRRETHVVYLRAPLEEIERRVDRRRDRGLVMNPNQTIADLFHERVPLYERYAHATVDTQPDRKDTLERVVARLTAEGVLALA